METLQEMVSCYVRVILTTLLTKLDSQWRGIDYGLIDKKTVNYFNNEEYQASKTTSDKKPEWKNVYSKENLAPADGAVNAFQFQDY